MAFSVISYTGDGSTTQFALNFTLGILSRDHVKCRVGTEVDGLGDPSYRTLTWINDGLVEVQGTVPANGEAVVFTRTVPKTALQHDYSNGAIIEESNLDESNKQNLMALHEILDGRLTSAFTNNLDMGGFKIVNLADGEDDTDAATYQQLVDMTGNAPAYAAAAAASATDAETAQTAAEAAQSAAEDAQAAAEAAAALLPLNNFEAGAAPTANDDSGDGYSKGSKWIDNSASPKEAYMCVDASLGAAVWVTTTLDSEDLGSAAFTASSAYATAAQGTLADSAVQPGDAFSAPFLHIQDQKAAGTDGGGFTASAWQTRTLNTEVTDEIGSTLSSNQFTLPAGTYYIEADAPAFSVNSHKSKLYNVTDASDVMFGTTEYAANGSYSITRSRVTGRFTIADTKTFELRHYCTVTKATNGMGTAANIGVIEIYSDVKIWKVS